MKHRCPRCQTEIEYDLANPYRPFCSKRCRESDLYSWLNDEPKIPASAEDEPMKKAELPASSPETRH